MDNKMYCVQTCGLCETICDEDEVPTHECLQGYSNFITDDNLYFYPLLEDGKTIVKRSLIQGAETIASVPFHGDNQENIRSINNNKDSNQKNAKVKLSPEEEKMLILEVQCREPLWNFRLPLIQRNCRITRALWEEVSKALNGKLSAAGCKSKFKNFHDTYRRLVNAEKLPSGSASKSNISKWKHYKSMEFLRNSCLQKSTISNINDGDSSSITENDNELDYQDEDMLAITNNEDSQDTSRLGDHIRKRRRTESQNSHLERIADALCQPPPNIVLPPPPSQEDHIDAFLKLFGHNLRKLSPEKQDEWI
ncbi:PREDICTED: uncharacterized protein LOC108783153 [Cyphomyrmex costatus]|uniref:uncharacterized protein LOC108783153 n=1 Tax=Cyphomyrmex costatus TaxID=456900 RepID=UPI0008524425|nr:PREDICTED: uncharacterized protein LOC108783153 [Cyphomyrmex costatus]